MVDQKIDDAKSKDNHLLIGKPSISMVDLSMAMLNNQMV